VEVQDLKNGATHYWSLEKLRQRLELMREMYHNEAELSPTSPQQHNTENLSGNDPFYDRFPWFRLVGRSFMHISNLFYPVTLVHKAAIVNDRGEVKGYLRIAVQSVTDDDDVPVGVKQSGNAKIKFNDKDYICKRKDKFKRVSSSTILAEQCSLDEMRVVEGERTEQNHSGMKEVMGSEPDTVTLTDQSSDDVTCLSEIKEEDLPEHLQLGKTFTFRVTILQVCGLSQDYADVFCQFNFLHRFDEAFSTEPIKNSGKNQPLSFYHLQNFTTTVTKSFIDYIKNHPIVFEVFGHYQQHPLHNQARDTNSCTEVSPPRTLSCNMAPPSSKPVPSTKIPPPLKSHSASHVYAKYDLLVWFEIQELAPNGEYTMVNVDHTDGQYPGNGTFLLHQGIQRRLALTIMHENGPELLWRDVREIVVGRIRTTPLWDEPDSEHSVLSLSLLPAHYLRPPGEDRVFFRGEAAWDSSLHNSALLNRVTPYGEKVYLTISAYLEVENCSQPVCITKDLCIVLYSRDTRLTAARSLKSLFGQGFGRPRDSGKVTGVYELLLRQRSDTGSQRCQRKVLDTSSTYVRGEENLRGWRPRGDSLIVEHQWELEKLTRLELVEKCRHVLLLREKLHELNHMQELSKLDKEASNKFKKAMSSRHGKTTITTTTATEQLSDKELLTNASDTKQTSSVTSSMTASDMSVSGRETKSDTKGLMDTDNETDPDRKLMAKCLRLMLQGKVQLNPTKLSATVPADIEVITTPADDSSPLYSSDSDDSSDEHVTAAILPHSKLHNSYRPCTLEPKKSVSSDNLSSAAGCDGLVGGKKVSSSMREFPDEDGLFVPDVEEIRISPVVSRKGYLNFLDETNGWIKRYVVVRRPFVYLYHGERDLVERGLINLATSTVEFNDESQDMIKARNTFSIVTQHRGILLQTLDDKEFHDWLYAIDPLLAGQIRSKSARRKPTLRA